MGALLAAVAGLLFFASLALWLNARRKVKELRARLRRQGALLTGAAQQLRAPLNDVLGLFQTLALRADEFSEDTRTLIDAVAGSGAAAKAILLDVFDILDYESGQLRIGPRIEILSDVINSVRRISAPLAERKGVRLDFDIKPSAQALLVFDDTRLRQCIFAMIRQAVEQSEKTVRVSVDAAQDPRHAQERRILIAVKDDFAGVSADFADHYFSAHDSSRSRRTSSGSSPLSLVVARLLAREMKGDLVAQCAPGSGVSFHLEIPAKFVRAAQGDDRNYDLTPVEAAASLAGGKTILIAQDDAASLQVLETFLKRVHPKKIITVKNGEEALSRLAAESCDLILMDAQMPVINGVCATERIRKSGAPWRNAPVIMTGAGAQSQEREASYKAGANAYLAKPVCADELYEKIAKVAAA